MKFPCPQTLTFCLLTLSQCHLFSQDHPTSQRDWEKYPPITDSDVIRYEIEHNIPLEERFDYLEKKAMSDWYHLEAMAQVIDALSLHPESLKEAFHTSLQKIKNSDRSPFDKERLSEEIIKLRDHTQNEKKD